LSAEFLQECERVAQEDKERYKREMLNYSKLAPSKPRETSVSPSKMQSKKSDLSQEIINDSDDMSE
jgi:hypothetical protein